MKKGIIIFSLRLLLKKYNILAIKKAPVFLLL